MSESITTDGVERVAALVAQDFRTMVFGTGQTTPTPTDSALEAQVHSVECFSVSVTGSIITYQARIDPGDLADVTLTEIGIVNGTGILLRREVRAGVLCNATHGAIFTIPVEIGGDV